MARKPIAVSIVLGIVALAAAAPASATFPGRNGRIAYATPDGISTMRPNGTDASQVLAYPGARDPVFSPNGEKLAFAAPGAKGHLRIYWTWWSFTRHLHRVSHTGRDRWRPSWSPDGKQLAVLGKGAAANGSNRAAVIVLNIADKKERKVATAAADLNFGDAEWSPDGSAIAFTDTDIFLVSPEGGDPVQVTHEPGDFDEERPDGTTVHHYGHSIRDLSWAPRSRRLAFTDLVNCPCDDEFNVAVVKRDGSGRRDFPSSESERDVVWAPDGSRIGLCHYQPFVSEPSLWTMRSNGSQRSELLNGVGCGAAWQSAP